MGLVKKDDGWRMPDELWAKFGPLLPSRPAPPLGCHNLRVPDRQAMDAVLLVLRTGMQWEALKATGIGAPSTGLCSHQQSETPQEPRTERAPTSRTS